MALGRRRRQNGVIEYKLCSLLLSYPDEELLGARPELIATVADLPASPAATALERFCEWWGPADPLALQQHYVHTFDLDKRCGLYLTFYDQGDKRDRGAALLRLRGSHAHRVAAAASGCAWRISSPASPVRTR